MRSRFPVLLVLVLGFTLLPMADVWGPHPVPTRVQTLDLDSIAVAGGHGMSGVDQPTASRSAVVETKPFGLVGLSWDTAPPAGSTVKVRVREQSGWTSWLTIPYDAEHGPDEGSDEAGQALAGTDPMLTGESDAIQVWVQTPDGQAPSGTRVHLVDTDNVDVQPLPPAQASAAPGMPPIITRAQWGADESKRNRGPIYSKVVKVGFVHHTVSSSTYTEAQAAAQVRNLYAWYTEGLKYSDMAYNFLVDRFGRLYEGRYGGMDKPVVGGHTAGLNNDSFAVSAMGNFEEFKPADAQMDVMKESIAKLLAWKLGLSKRDPGGKDTLISTGSLNSGFWEKDEVATLNRVSGHRDAGNTACPGKYLYAQVPDIRARAAQIYRNAGSEPPRDEIPDLITPDPVTDEFNFRGAGYGDGVGLPKAGVLGQARDGKKAAGILKHYLDGRRRHQCRRSAGSARGSGQGQTATGVQPVARQGRRDVPGGQGQDRGDRQQPHRRPARRLRRRGAHPAQSRQEVAQRRHGVQGDGEVGRDPRCRQDGSGADVGAGGLRRVAQGDRDSHERRRAAAGHRQSAGA